MNVSSYTKALLVSDHQFVLIFLGIIERDINTTIPSDVSFLITRYADVTKRVDWCKSQSIGIMDDHAITKTEIYGMGTVLCGDGAQLDRSRWTKFEVVFRINKMSSYIFQIGYVFGSAQDFNFGQILGRGSNEKNSVGISIGWNKFLLCDEDHSNKRLKCEAMGRPHTFPQWKQIWRVSWDLNDYNIQSVAC